MRLKRSITRYALPTFLLAGIFALPAHVTAQVPQNQQPMALQNRQAPIAANNGQTPTNQNTGTNPLSTDNRVEQLFGSVNQLDRLSVARRPLALSPGANAVFSAEATGRKTSDIGSLLQESKAAQGISIQKRTPIINDTRIRGQRVGQVLASGSYWGPARMDLDTMMNKIDSRLIEDAVIVKGPYATRYGPGFRFVDMEFKKSPRYDQLHHHGSTSFSYNTNGQQFYGRQTVQGADGDMGYLLSYGHQTGNDVETGQSGFFLPSSYKSRDIFAAVGKDISPYESLELNIIRLDQTDVEFPGLVYDLNYLVTDGYELTYVNEAPGFADRFESEIWYNRTRFEGDTLRDGKNRQIPDLRLQLEPSAFGADDGFAITDGDALSGGYRLISTYDTGNGTVSLGTDLNIISQELNDIEPFAPANDNNFPIPRSLSVDVGMFVEKVQKTSERLTQTAGARIDGVFTDSEEFVPGVPDSYVDIQDSQLEQEFFLGAAYWTADYQVNQCWNVKGGLGTSNRAPSLTELYADNTFIGSLQRGLTFLAGDAQLDTEKLYQVDLGAHYQSQRTSFGINGYHSWIQDFITYDLNDPAGTIDGFQVGAQFVNTDLATIAGLEAYGQYQATPILSFFGMMSATEGRDHTREEPSRFGFAERSSVAGVEKEPLPGINPFEARVGFLLQDPNPNPQWGFEVMARVVDNQDRVAATLGEIDTPGFTTVNIRSYRRLGQVLLTAGVENVGNRFYREHVDYRSGLGVFQPGIGFYFGTEVEY